MYNYGKRSHDEGDISTPFLRLSVDVFLFKYLTHCYFARLTLRYVITSTLKRHRHDHIWQTVQRCITYLTCKFRNGERNWHCDVVHITTVWICSACESSEIVTSWLASQTCCVFKHDGWLQKSTKIYTIDFWSADISLAAHNCHHDVTQRPNSPTSRMK